MCSTRSSDDGKVFSENGVRDTYNGGAIMAASEFTLAEMLKKVNYQYWYFWKMAFRRQLSLTSRIRFDESLISLGIGRFYQLQNGNQYF